MRQAPELMKNDCVCVPDIEVPDQPPLGLVVHAAKCGSFMRSGSFDRAAIPLESVLPNHHRSWQRMGQSLNFIRKFNDLAARIGPGLFRRAAVHFGYRAIVVRMEVIMKSFIAAIAAAIRAMPRFIWQRVCVAGEWVSRLVSVPAEPVASEPAGSVPASVEDEDSVASRAIAGLLLAGQIPAPELSGKVSEDRFAWLCSLTPSMLKAVVEADKQALRDHLRQKRNIKGVLAADAATVCEYNRRRDQEDDADMTWKQALSM